MSAQVFQVEPSQQTSNFGTECGTYGRLLTGDLLDSIPMLVLGAIYKEVRQTNCITELLEGTFYFLFSFLPVPFFLL